MVYDVGSCLGHDSVTYLLHGYRVVAVDASPDAVAFVRRLLHSEIRRERFALHHAAFGPPGEQNVELLIHPTMPQFSSMYHQIASRPTREGPVEPTPVHVPTIHLRELFEQHGVPHYLKIDIEGADMFCLRQLTEVSAAFRPRYVSIEHNSWTTDALAVLRELGYDGFRVVEQRHHPHPYLFGSTGPFGEDCVDIERGTASWRVAGDVPPRTELPEGGLWYDLHARRD